MLDIEITRRCNLKCITCFVRHAAGGGEELTKLQVYEIIDDAKRFYGECLHLTGGEPFIHPDIFDIIDYGIKSGYPNIIVNTNGTLLDEDKVKYLSGFGDVVHLTVSVDGFEEMNDKIRGRGVFGKVVETLELLSEYRINCSVMSVVTKELLSSLNRWIDFLLEKFPFLNGIHLIPVGDISCGAEGAVTANLNSEEILKLGIITASYIHDGKPVAVIDYPIVNLVLMRFGVPMEKIFQCMACSKRICIQANLDITPCHPVSYRLGSYKKGVLEEVRNSRDFNDISNRNYETCSDCEYKVICGNCRAFVTASGFEILGNNGSCNDILRALGMA